MAVTQISRWQFLQDNPYGTFVTGDVLDFYVDPDLAIVPTAAFGRTDGITVNLNGVSLPSSATLILSFGPPLLSIQEFNPQICIGTTLLEFSKAGFFPYVRYRSLENNYACVVNSPTCDLIVVGVPTVVPATATDSADGAITLDATSSNLIKYKLGSDFSYEDGTGQTSNTFSGLLPGDHRIYLRDEANCAVNILVTIGVSNDYGTKFRLEYNDLNGWLSRYDITKRGYAGAVTEIIADGSPVTISLRGEGSIDKFDPMLAVELRMLLISVTDLQFLELYTNDPNLYRVEFSKDTGNTVTVLNPVTVSLPALSTWLSQSASAAIDWTTGTAPSVSLAGTTVTPVVSEYLYVDYAFTVGYDYSIIVNFTKITTFGGSNPRTATLAITNGSFVTQFIKTIAASEGSNSINIIFTATASCTRIGFKYTSGSSVTITVNSTEGIETDPAGTEEPAGLETKLIAKVLPQQYQEEFINVPYAVGIVATCSLPELRDYYLIQDDGQMYYGEVKLIKLIAQLLKPLKLNLPIRVACNLYATTMVTEDGSDPFDQAYCDFEAFYLGKREPDHAFVLQSILEPFGCRIVQWGGRWNIIRVEEQIAAYDYRDFDEEGEYTGYGTYDPVKVINVPSAATDAMFSNRDQGVEMQPGYGLVKVNYHLGLKPNILKNGDFRLKSSYYQPDNIYFFEINRTGWTLVNAGYVINETYELINENNIAYVLTSKEDTLSSIDGGEAYLQSGAYNVKMGTDNSMKITVRCKVDRTTAQFGGGIIAIEVPYVKVRIRVKYGSLYLQADGSWTSTVNKLTYFVTEWNKYNEFEIVAKQPTTGTPITGMDFDVRLYHAYAYHAEYQSIAALKALPTYVGVDQVIPTGYKTEIRDDFTLPSYIYYYELEENTDAENSYSIVRPTDYHATLNPRQWIQKKRVYVGGVVGTNIFPFHVDRVVVKFLVGGEECQDTIIRQQQAESNNNTTLEKDLYLGSYSNLIVTQQSYGIELGAWFPGTKAFANLKTTSVLTADLIYAGYLRSISGEGYEFWARDGVSESDKLHGLWLKMVSAQYNRSWRLMRGSFVSKDTFIELIDVLRVAHNSNRIFQPSGLELMDRDCEYTGELLELISPSDDSDGSGSSPYSSGFSTGFGSSGFN
jgi:hypothetical protein